MQTTLDKQYERDANFRKDMERAAEMLEHYAEKLVELAKRIETMPEFLTKAEDQIDRAHSKLLEAMEMITQKPRKK
jgi:hypothetical protein